MECRFESARPVEWGARVHAFGRVRPACFEHAKGLLIRTEGSMAVRRRTGSSADGAVARQDRGVFVNVNVPSMGWSVQPPST
jgi:hypothetical protein